MLILNRRVVYVVRDASTTPKCWFVMISADNKTLKVWHMLGTRRWTRNGALEKGGCDKCPCCLQRWKQYIIPMLYKAERPCFFVFLCMFYMLATYAAKVLQVCYHFKGRIFHAVLSQHGCEKRIHRQIGNNYLSEPTPTKYQQLSVPFPGQQSYPYLSPLYSNPQEKYPQFQHRERITAFPYVVPCRHSHINLSLVSCSFIYP